MQNVNSTPSDRFLITAREAAKMLSISERTLFSLTHDGGLPCIRIGRALRYDIADIRDWIAENKTRSTAD